MGRRRRRSGCTKSLPRHDGAGGQPRGPTVRRDELRTGSGGRVLLGLAGRAAWTAARSAAVHDRFAGAPLRRRPAVRQQFWQLLRCTARQTLQHVTQVAPRLDPQTLARLHQAVQHRCRLPAAIAAKEQVVLTANRHRAGRLPPRCCQSPNTLGSYNAPGPAIGSRHK